jgi:hypothetical protein
MARPPRDPHYYSDSTDLRCPACSKLCASKAGRVRHIRAKHGSISSELLDSSDNAVLDLEDDLPQTPVQSPQPQTPVQSPQELHLASGTDANSNFVASPVLSMFPHHCESSRALNLFQMTL